MCLVHSAYLEDGPRRGRQTFVESVASLYPSEGRPLISYSYEVKTMALGTQRIQFLMSKGRSKLASQCLQPRLRRNENRVPELLLNILDLSATREPVALEPRCSSGEVRKRLCKHGCRKYLWVRNEFFFVQLLYIFPSFK